MYLLIEHVDKTSDEFFIKINFYLIEIILIIYFDILIINPSYKNYEKVFKDVLIY